MNTSTAVARAAPPSTSRLFPIEHNAEATRLIYRRARRERDQAGKMLLDTPLTADERQTISARLAHLSGALVPARRDQIQSAIAAMIMGFGKAAGSDVEAAAIVAQYMAVLDGLPAFAVARACRRFSNGEVEPEELGLRRLDTSFAPSTAQLKVVAEAIVNAPRDEAVVASMLLAAGTETPLGERNVPKVQAMHQQFHKRMAEAAVAENAERARLRAESDAREAKIGREAMIAEYEECGLEPVYTDKAKTLVVSLGLLLHMGWTIIDGPDGAKLVKP